jgi:hypothetical protein
MTRQVNYYSQPFYEVWLCNNLGKRIALLDRAITFGWMRGAGAVGGIDLIVPDYYPDHFWIPDNSIQYWRTPSLDHPPQLVSFGYVEKIELKEHGGADIVHVSGGDQMRLLEGRAVQLVSGSKEYSGPTDDLMKDMVRRNLGNLATDPLRDLTAYGLTVLPDASAGTEITIEASFETVLDSLRDFFAASATKEDANGETHPTYFDLQMSIDNDAVQYRFITAQDFIGADRTSSSPKPAIFGREWGNMESPQFVADFTGEANYIYGLGNSEEKHKLIQQAWVQKGLAALAKSPMSRKEKVVIIRKFMNKLGLLDGTRAAAHVYRPHVKFTATLKDTPQTKFGVDWKFGDLVTGVYRNQIQDGMISAVGGTVNEAGQEQLVAKLEIQGVQEFITDGT